MADRSGVRVGYRIIQIGTNNTIKESHDHIVHLLHTAVGQVSSITVDRCYSVIFRLTLR